MCLPKWASSEASAQVSKLREQGEGQHVEFKEDFPTQAHGLAKEVAALATSGGGTILIGIHNNGDVAGLEAVSEEDRDKAIHRAQGILRSVVPAVQGKVSPASDNDKFVLVIEIDEQAKPVFYYDGRPYIREGRESRTATPDEVQRRVWDHGSSNHRRRLEDSEFERKKRLDEQMQRSDERDEKYNDALKERWLRLLR